MAFNTMAAALKAAAPKAAVVVEREVLFTGPVVKIRVPRDARRGSYPQAGKPTPYLHFSHSVPGGVVNIFVHTKGQFLLLGSLVTGTATVFKKTLSDGREYLYVDIVPVGPDVAVTHRLVIGDAKCATDPAPEHVFETPAPIRARIVFAPPDAKVAS